MRARFELVISLLVTGLPMGCERRAGPETREVALEERVAEPEEEPDRVYEADRQEAEVVFDGVPRPVAGADEDGDGFVRERDQDDRDPSTYPGAPEQRCDGVDQDGDGLDDCPPDADGDGIRASADCDDRDPTVHPLAIELLDDGVDQNCNGLDERDEDGDGVLDHADLDPDDPAVGPAAQEEDRSED